MISINHKNFYNNKIFVIFLICSIFYCSGSTISSIFVINKYILLLVTLAFLIPIIANLISNVANFQSSFFLIFAVMILINTLFYFKENLAFNVSVFLSISTAYGLVTLYKFEDFVRISIKIITIIVVIALIGYYLNNYTNILRFLPTMTNVNGVVYTIGGIFNFINSIPDRNIGVFWEPGLLATFCIYGIILEVLFNINKINVVRLLLFYWCLYTTKSSAGYLLGLVSILMILVRNEKMQSNKNITNIIKSFLIIFLLLLILNLENIILHTSLINNEYISKLLFSNILSSSRTLAIKQNLSIFLSNPIIGLGWKEVVIQAKYVNDTSTSTFLMSIFGILGSLYTVYFVYGIIKIKNINYLSKICLIFIILAIINKEPHYENVFTWIFFFYILGYKGQTGDIKV